MLFTLLRGLVRRRALRTEVLRAMNSGVGFYETSFSLTGLRKDALLHEIRGWCRETLARTDRPYGLDHLTLALSLETPDGARSAAATLPVLRPADFYDGGNALEEIASAIDAWSPSTLAAGSNAGRLHVVLFSWGDLTRELLPAG